MSSGFYAAQLGATVKPDDLHVPFIENTGQFDSAVAYSAGTFAGRVFVTRDGRIVTAASAGSFGANSGRGVAIYEQLQGSAPIEVAGEEAGDAAISYLGSGQPENASQGAKSYAWVSLGEVYPGVRARLRARSLNVEKFFHIAPGADPAVVAVQVTGIQGLSVNSLGQLVLQTELGELAYSAPIAWQISSAGARVPVQVAYQVDADSDRYGFRVGDYDPSRELVIDPLIASTFIGGDDLEAPWAVVHHNDSIYLSGLTLSHDFPTTPGAYDTLQNGPNGQAFVSRFDQDLTTLQASTFIGVQFQNSVPQTTGVYLDAYQNDVFIAFNTYGSGNPTPPITFDSTHNGGSDIYIARLSGNLTNLDAASYFGGSDDDTVNVLDIDEDSGQVCIAGSTLSNDLPVTGSAHDTSYNGNRDGFVSCLSAALLALNKSSYYGTTSIDVVNGIHTFGGSVLAAGHSTLPASLPLPNGAFTTPFGASDGFVAFFGPSAQLVSATLIGSDGTDIATDVVLSNTKAFVTGYVGSGTGFPNAGGFDSSYNGGLRDVFLVRFDGFLSTLEASTFVGGDDTDNPLGLEADSAGDIYLFSQSNSIDFPTTPNAFRSTRPGNSGTVLSRFDPNLALLQYSTWFRALNHPGSTNSHRFAIPSPNLVFLPGTTATGAIATDGAYQTDIAGSNDGRIVKILAQEVVSEVSMGFLPLDVAESAGPLEIQLTRSGDLSGYAQVAWQTLDGTATLNEDYSGGGFTEFWQPGDGSPRTISLGIINDDIDELDETFNTGLLSPVGVTIAPFGGGRMITILDDDTAGVSVSAPTPDATLQELPDSVSFDVVLDSQPANGPLFMGMFSNDESAGTLQGADGNGFVQLVFDDSNWNVPQQVTVLSVDDDIDDGDQAFAVDFTQILNPDPNYDGLIPASVALVTLDDDNAGVVFQLANTPLMTSEDGTMDTFQVSLASEPLTAVQLILSPDPAGQDEGDLDSPSPFFDALNWDVPQTITVTGLDDMVIDGDILYEILYEGISADPLYDFAQTSFGPLVLNEDNDETEVDVSVTVDDGNSQMMPFIPELYQVVIANAAPEQINDVDVVSASLRLDESSMTWTCTPIGLSNCDQASGTGNIATTVDLEPNGSVTFEVSASAINQPFEQAILSVEAVVPFGFDDTDPSDNLASDSNLIFVFIIFSDGLEGSGF